MCFSDHLLEAGADLWTAQKNHPFVHELAEGTLDEAVFRTWLKQDHRYLHDHVRTFAILGTKAREEATMAHCFSVAGAIDDEEMDLHREFAAEYGLTPGDLASAEKVPTCVAYTNYLLRTARERPLGGGAAAIYPCGQGCLDIAKHMVDLADGEHRYTPFIQKYTSDEFRESAAWMRELVGRCAEYNLSLREEIETAFRRSTRLEHAFWKMAHTEKSWPHERSVREGA